MTLRIYGITSPLRINSIIAPTPILLSFINAPLNPVADLTQLTEADRASFPEIALEVTNRLDGVFGIEMAYIAAWHQAPVRVGRDLLRLHWQITSVRRAPGKLKYLSGSESAMGAFIMDLRPEQSAEQLRTVVL